MRQCLFDSIDFANANFGGTPGTRVLVPFCVHYDQYCSYMHEHQVHDFWAMTA
jgi:hypothetical protein